jgi:hypothetical protein
MNYQLCETCMLLIWCRLEVVGYVFFSFGITAGLARKFLIH